MTLVNAQWYELPERWVDAIDIEEKGKGAIELLRDMIVKRTTEYSRFKRLYFRALGNGLTVLPRQQQALELADEARQLGLTETTYISERLGINRHSAYKLLKRAEERLIIITYQDNVKMETFDHSQGIYHEAHAKIDLKQSDIDQIAGKLTYDCPTRPYNFDACEGKTNGKYGICRECAKLFGLIQGERPDWVEFLVREVKAQARQDARDILFQKRHGVNIDIQDIA